MLDRKFASHNISQGVRVALFSSSHGMVHNGSGADLFAGTAGCSAFAQRVGRIFAIHRANLSVAFTTLSESAGGGKLGARRDIVGLT